MRIPALLVCASLVAVAQGCGSLVPALQSQSQTSAVKAVAMPADPLQEIMGVAQQIWQEAGIGAYEPVFQIVSGSRNASPKYAFLNEAVDRSNDGSTLYRAGSYAISTRKATVAISLLDSPATSRNPGEVPEVTKAVKDYILDTYEHRVTKLILNQQGPGRDKFAFLALSENQPEATRATVWTWYYVGTYAVGAKDADVRLAVGSGKNTPDSYTIDRRGGKR